MSSLIIANQKVWWGGYDITGDLEDIDFSLAVDSLEKTALGATTRTFAAGGLESVDFNYSGFWNADTGEIDAPMFSNMGAAIVVSVGAIDGSDGSTAFSFKSLHNSYVPSGAVGEMFKFSAGGNSAADRLVSGTILHPATARTASGNGTARQIGAVSATQKVYGSLHVLAASGTSPTLDVVVESDDAGGFASPATVLTFSQFAAIGAERQSASGAITDDYWRVTYTIGGTSPSFTFVVVLGIR